ncbi:MAG: ABC transporter permease [Bryobacterales bacterium]
MNALRQDLGYALRGLWRSRGFSLTVIAAMTVGIASTTALFGLLYTLMLRPLPVDEPEDLVELVSQYPGDPRLNTFAWKYFEHFREHNEVFSGLTGVAAAELEVQFDRQFDQGAGAKLRGGYVPANFFGVLGLRPLIGRLLDERDNEPAADGATAAVLSWDYWNGLGRDPSIVGRRVEINGLSAVIVGVTPRGFRGLQLGAPQRIWLPAGAAPGAPSLALIGRLAPGVSREQAETQTRVLDRWRIDDLVQASPTHDPALKRMQLSVESASAGLSPLRDRFGKPLLALMAAVGTLLCLLCINVSGMLLARAETRGREMAIRTSLGASPARLLRQTLTEALALSSLAALLGVALASYGTDFLVRILASARPMPGAAPLDLEIPLDARVLLFNTAAALLTGLLFGIAPALRAMRTRPARFLRTSGASTQTRGERVFARGLVSAQVALSVVLLSAAVLFVGHLSRLRNTGVGFEPDNLMLVSLGPNGNTQQGGENVASYDNLLTRLQAIPGIGSASLVGAIPISGAAASEIVQVEGFEESEQARSYVYRNNIGPQYFRSMGTPLLAGREIEFADASGPRVAIINRTFAEHYFPGGDPIGKHVTFDRNRVAYEVVGVASDAKYTSLDEPAPRTIYLPAFYEDRVSARNLVLQTQAAPRGLESAVRRVVGETLPASAVVRITTMQDVMDASIVPERLVASLSGWIGMLGALLAAIGLYGLLAYAVSRRMHEIGVRQALGATPRAMRAMIVRDAFAMVAAGLALGAPLAWMSARLAESVFGTLAADWTAPVAAMLAMGAVGWFAAYVPGRRAAAVDPIQALRSE